MLFNENKLRVVFFGSSSFALPVLETLNKSENVILAVTKPDKPAGRGYKPLKTIVKKRAEFLKLNIAQPLKLSAGDFILQVESLKPDLFLVVDYGKILPKRFFQIPPKGAIALHPSLLPKYRGPAPVETAIMNGEEITGTTAFFIDEELDSGDIICQRQLKIDISDTAGTLREKLSILSAEVLKDVLVCVKEDKIKRVPQDDKFATFTYKINADKALINWNSSAGFLYNLIRALNPNPGAFTKYKGRALKILEAEEFKDLKGIPGRIEGVKRGEGFFVGALDSQLLVKGVQPEGKKAMSGWDFVSGYRIKAGDNFE